MIEQTIFNFLVVGFMFLTWYTFHCQRKFNTNQILLCESIVKELRIMQDEKK